MLYWISRLFFVAIFKLFFRLKVEGLERLPAKQNFLLVSNHASFLDPFAISAAIPRYIRWIVVDEYFDIALARWFLKNLRFIRTKGKTDSRALHQSLFALKQGDIVGLFPEGRRTWDGKLGSAYSGMALMALKSGVPVVPIGISGSFEAWPRTRKFVKFSPITVRIGEPIDFSAQCEAKITREALDEVAGKIMSSVKSLLSE